MIVHDGYDFHDIACDSVVNAVRESVHSRPTHVASNLGVKRCVFRDFDERPIDLLLERGSESYGPRFVPGDRRIVVRFGVIRQNDPSSHSLYFSATRRMTSSHAVVLL